MTEVYLYIAGFVIFGIITILAIIGMAKNTRKHNDSDYDGVW
jgi:hypothetical protein